MSTHFRVTLKVSDLKAVKSLYGYQKSKDRTGKKFIENQRNFHRKVSLMEHSLQGWMALRVADPMFDQEDTLSEALQEALADAMRRLMNTWVFSPWSGTKGPWP